MKTRVAVSKEFMESYSRLPKVIQKKVREFTEKFQRDPTQSGINFERIEAARDEKVRSVRIDQAYRAIIVHPPKGDVYLCVWVDHHDDAYRWVRDKRFEVNPTTGVFQLFEMVEEAAEEVVARESAVDEQAVELLASFDDEDLLLAGVPAPLLAAVRALQSEEDLDRLAPHLPSEAAEMLYLFAAGYDLVGAIEEAERSKAKLAAVDVEDFEAALAKPESRQHFKVVEDERVLEEMLDAPLEQWRIFLHPSQRKLAEIQANGPVRVLGGASTGKTVVLMHRAKHLASEVFNGKDDRILVTTFTRNLAMDLKANLENLCGDAMERIEVTNLHSWCASFMRKQGHRFAIVDEPERERLFDQARSEMGGDEFPLRFYREEWDQVVQAQDVRERDGYLTARRVGRGTRISRRQRAQIWQVLARYRELLQENRWMEWQDAVRETRLFIEKQKIATPYRSVLADEVQDFTAPELRLLRTLAPVGANDLFLVGDGHQRIYGQPTRLGSCGIEIRGRARRLKLNYRTTEQIRDHAVAILEGREIDDLDGGLDDMKGYFSLRRGPKPEIQHFAREAEEATSIMEKIKAWLEEVPPESICLAARTRAQLRDRYERLFETENIPVVVVEKDPESEARKPGVRLATMHRMKGLEFSRVLLAGIQEGTMPLVQRDGPSPDEASVEDHELKERCLLYVAATRARDELFITGYGTRSPFLANKA